jgi:hypothetical protein
MSDANKQNNQTDNEITVAMSTPISPEPFDDEPILGGIECDVEEFPYAPLPVKHGELPEGAYTIAARIERGDRTIGYVLVSDCLAPRPTPVCAVEVLVRAGKVSGVQMINGELCFVDGGQRLSEMPSDEGVLETYATAKYEAPKHPYKTQYWRRVRRDDRQMPTLLIIGTFRDDKDVLLGYEVFCPDTLDIYSVHLMETHQIMDMKYHVCDFMGEKRVLRGLSDWCWRLYLADDREAMEKLPRHVLGRDDIYTGGHLERDNLFRTWDFKQEYDRVIGAAAKEFAELLIANAEHILGDDEE